MELCFALELISDGGVCERYVQQLWSVTADMKVSIIIIMLCHYLPCVICPYLVPHILGICETNSH